MKDITLGQYFPGNSVLHKMDPRAKLISAIIYIAVVFTSSSAGALAFLAAATVAIMLISGIPISVYLRGLRPILFILALTAALNLFMTRGETVAFEFWIVKIYVEGINNAILMAVRITTLVLGSCVFLSYTTSPIALTDGLESLLGPLSKLHVPVHDFSMMMTIALRFIPLLIEETDKIMSAQKARGSDFSSGGPVKRVRALLPILIPLFVSSFKRAEELAVAMECRCYRGDVERTHMKVLRYGALDFVVMASLLVLLSAVIAINIFAPIYAF